MPAKTSAEKEELSPVPRDIRTPISDAGEVVMRLADVFHEIRHATVGSDDGGALYIEKIFGEAYNYSRTNGDEKQAEFWKEMEQRPSDTAKVAVIHAILIATAYAVQAMKAASASTESLHCPDAWRYAADAMRWEGIVVGTWGIRKGMPTSVNEVARKGADARHARHRAYKQIVIETFKAGSYKSKNQAAEKIAGVVVPLSFRAVREHLKDI